MLTLMNATYGHHDRSGSNLFWLFRHLWPLRRLVLLTILLAVVVGFATAIDPLFLRALIDTALPKRDLAQAVVLSLGIAGCFFARTVFNGLEGLSSFAVSQRFMRGLRLDLLEHLNQLSIEYHEQTPPGETLTCLQHDVDEIATLGTDIATDTLRAVLLLVLNVLMMVRLSLYLTVVIMPLFPLFIFVQKHFRMVLRLRADDARATIGCANAVITEHLSALPQIQYLGAEKLRSVCARDAWDEMLFAEQRQRTSQALFGISVGVIFIVAILIVLGLGSRAVIVDDLTIGSLVAFYAYIGRIFDPISSAMDFYSRFQSVRASINRVRTTLSTSQTIPDLGTREVVPKLCGMDLCFDNVSVLHATTPILDDISVRIRFGERIAIAGETGAGKTTLARLMVRARDPNKGVVSLGGHPVRDYSLHALRAAICYNPQQPWLINGSIRDNLLLSNPGATSDELMEAIEVAQLGAILSHFASGLDSPVGPNGALLSGGERQRIAIARSLLRKSPILVLDEATSALDLPTEHALLTALDRFNHGRTIIFISHRISSLTWVDRILVLDEGELTAGPHEFLYSHCAHYRQLFEASLSENSAFTVAL